MVLWWEKICGVIWLEISAWVHAPVQMMALPGLSPQPGEEFGTWQLPKHMSCDRMTDWPPLLIHVTDRTSLLCIAPVCKMGSYKPVMLCFAAFAALLQLSYGFTPPTAHTIGQPWPKPANMTQTADVQALSMDTFQFMVTGNNCDLLRGALNRYFKIIFYTGRDGQDSTLRFRPRPSYGANLLPSLSVNVKSACLDTADKRLMPSLDMDESCKFQQ